MITKPRFIKFVLYGFIVFGIVMLMLPISFRLNSIQHEFWNMGHAIAFAFVYALIPRVYVYLDHLSVSRYYFVVIVSAFCIASVTEFIQQFIPGRSVSLVDMYLDVLGALIGCTIHLLLISKRRVYIYILMMALVGLVYPSHVVFVDEYVKKLQFPVLSDIRYKSELRRWSGKNKKIVCVGPDFAKRFGAKTDYADYAFEPENSVIFSNKLTHHKCGLLVPISDEQYSSTYMHNLYSNWEGYTVLSIEIYVEEASELTFRVNDFQHELLFENSDRFNQVVLVKPGFNTIEFEINKIKNAPKTRKMNIREISSFGIFSTAPHILQSYMIFSVKLK